MKFDANHAGFKAEASVMNFIKYTTMGDEYNFFQRLYYTYS